MKKFHLLIGGIYLLLSLPLSAERIRVALPDVPGVMYRDEAGEPSGFYLDLLEAVFQELDVDISWEDGSWSEMLEAVETGDLDLLPVAAVTDERKKTLDFVSTPVITTWSELYINQRTPFSEITDLQGKEIGLVSGDNNSSAFSQYVRDFGIDYIPVNFNDHDQAFRALIGGSIFAVAGPSGMEEIYPGQISRAGMYYNAVNSTIAFHKGSHRTLQIQVDDLLKFWKEDRASVYYQLLTEYSLVEPQELVLPLWFWPLMIGIIVLVMMSIGFALLLRVRVRQQTKKYLDTEKKLEQSQKMEAIGQLAGGVAHDFNNMLTGIMGYAELLLPSLSEKKQIEYCRQILDSSMQAAELTEQLLSFARKHPTHQQVLDLHEVLFGAQKLLLPSLDARITLSLELSAEQSQIMGDRTQLQNVFLNLGLNARDAMPRGGRLKILTENQYLTRESLKINGNGDWKPGAYVLTRIIDTGIGMDQKLIARIFEPFFTTKMVGKGTGLGLPAVLGTVKSHSGGLKVHSSPGQGTEFLVYLPLLSE